MLGCSMRRFSSEPISLRESSRVRHGGGATTQDPADSEAASDSWDKESATGSLSVEGEGRENDTRTESAL